MERTWPDLHLRRIAAVAAMNDKNFYRSVSGCFVFLLLLSLPVSAKPPASENEKDEVVASARASFMEIVTLWKDEKYGELYEFGTLRSQQRLSKEVFEKRMRKAKKRLECCWATVQDVKGLYKSSTEVHIKAKMGYRTAGSSNPHRKANPQVSEDPGFEHETFYLIHQNGRWRVNLFRILEKSGQ
jgi:hypothetical protein